MDDSRIYLTWGGLQLDLSRYATPDELRKDLENELKDATPARISNALGQLWSFAKRINKGDWVILPSKRSPAIHVAEVTGPYVFDGQASQPNVQFRSIRWIRTDIPRSVFPADLLLSFGAIKTISQIQRYDAEVRVRAMAESDWKSAGGSGRGLEKDDEEASDERSTVADLEEIGRDQIARLIASRFSGHGLAQLVNAVLRAQGYTTFVSPPGPDGGVDILAAPEPLGFGRPRICVQVKSGDSTVDLPTLNMLIGSMQNVGADQGLLVAWGGFKKSIDKERATQFFRVRLWDRDDLIAQLLEHYKKLNDEIVADLPLKRIWTVATPDDTAE